MTPTRLQDTLDKVRTHHPFLAVTPTAPGAQVAGSGELWREMFRTPLVQIDAAVSTLTVKQLRALLYGVFAALRGGYEPVVARVIASAAQRSRAWDEAAAAVYIAHNGDLPDARAAARRHMEHCAATSPLRSVADKQKPLNALAKSYLQAPQAFPEFLEAVGPIVRSAIETKLKLALLAETPRLLLAKEGWVTVKEWLTDSASGEERDNWYVLMASQCLRVEELDALAGPLTEMTQRYSKPSVEAPHSSEGIWHRVPKPSRKAIVEWVNIRELTKLLGDERRVAFWRRWSSHITNVTVTKDREAILLESDGWFAVQFVKTGKATFLLESRHRPGCARLLLAELYKKVLMVEPLGRYTHQGLYWEYNANAVVEAVINRVKQS